MSGGVFSKLAGAGKGATRVARAVLLKTATCLNGLRKGLGSSGALSLSSALLVGNILFFTAGGRCCYVLQRPCCI